MPDNLSLDQRTRLFQLVDTTLTEDRAQAAKFFQESQGLSKRLAQAGTLDEARASALAEQYRREGINTRWTGKALVLDAPRAAFADLEQTIRAKTQDPETIKYLDDAKKKIAEEIDSQTSYLVSTAGDEIAKRSTFDKEALKYWWGVDATPNEQWQQGQQDQRREEAQQVGENLANTFGDTPLRDVAAGVGQGAYGITGLLARIGGNEAKAQEDRDKSLQLGAGRELRSKQVGEGPVRAFLGEALSGAASSAVQFGALAPLGGAGVIAGFTSLTMNQAYDDGRDAGLGGAELAAYVTGMGAIEAGLTVAFGKLLGPGLEGMADKGALSRAISRGGLDAVRKVGVEVLKEVPEEVAISVAQAVVNKVSGVDPNALNQDSLLELVGQTVAQTILLTGGVHGVQMALAERQPGPTAAQLQTNAALAQELNRSPEREGKIADLATRAGVSPDMLRNLPDHLLDTDITDAQAVAAQVPGLQRFLAGGPDNVTVSKGDHLTLAQIAQLAENPSYRQEGVKGDATAEAVSFMQDQLAINQLVQESLTGQRSKVKLAEALETMGVARDVKIDAGVAMELMQDGNLQEGLRAAGITPAEITDAASKGQDVAANLGVLHTALTPEQFKAVAKVVKRNDGAASVAEIENLDRAAETGRAQESLAEYQKREEEARAEITRLAKEMQAVNLGAEPMSPEQITTTLQKLDAFDRRMAARGGERGQMLRKVSFQNAQVVESVKVSGKDAATEKLKQRLIREGYVEVEGFLVHPDVPADSIAKMSPASKQLLRDNGVVYIKPNFQGRNFGTADFTEVDGHKIFGVELGENTFENDVLIAHEVGHIVWWGLSAEQQSLLESRPRLTPHGKKTGSVEEDFAETFSVTKSARESAQRIGVDLTAWDNAQVVAPNAPSDQPVDIDAAAKALEQEAVAPRQQADVTDAELAPIPGLPKSSPGPIPSIVAAAKAYAAQAGIPYRRQSSYVKADPERGARIAKAFEEMKHDPENPEVKAAYAAMIKETLAQYEAVKQLGLKIEVIKDGMADPYPEGPKQVLDDLRRGHLWLFPTSSGFGTLTDIKDNPLLAPTDEVIDGHKLVANDIFRIVHDVFGHGKEGVGFGPSGEENTWQAHVRMYSPLAARAMTTETRGQNSWVNFGPHGEKNRANQKETVYADQKIGLLPEWVMTEGVEDEPTTVTVLNQIKPGQEPQGFQTVARNLTPEEKQKLRTDTAQKLVDLFKELPPDADFAEAAKAGAAKKGWYEKSTQAIRSIFGDVDASRFAALLAATSPQCSVETNLLNATNIWKNWVAAGRPTEREAIIDIMGQSVQGGKGRASVLDAWINNSVRALSAEQGAPIMLSGPKVNSFMLNLSGNVQEVTNDAWMANFALVDQAIFGGSMNVKGTDPGKGPGYLAMAAKVRRVAEKLTKETGQTWTPAEVQETVWSWAKTLYEMADAKDEKRTAEQLVKDGAITDEAVASTPDFSVLFTQDATVRSILEAAGYGNVIAAFESEGGARRDSGAAGAGQQGAAREVTPGLLRSARRLDKLREQRRSSDQGLTLDQGKAKKKSAAAPRTVAEAVAAGKPFKLIHWSKQDNLSETNPRFAGTAGAGQEKAAYSKGAKKRTYFGLYGRYRKEGQIGNFAYEVTIDPAQAYDIATDPNGYMDKAREKTKDSTKARQLADDMARKDGFTFFYSSSEGPWFPVLYTYEKVQGLQRIEDPASAGVIMPPLELNQDGELPRAQIRIDDKGYLIKVFQDADFSSITHELAHSFLAEFQSLIQSGRGSREAQKDWQTLMKWLQVKDGKITVEAHERFARGWEQYEMEGKAPAPGLMGAFQRFSHWIKEVYKDAKQYFDGVRLNDDVRRVFDRMLASEEDAARAVFATEQTVRSDQELKKLGLEPDEKKHVNDLLEAGRAKLEAQLSRARNKELRPLMAKWRKEAAAEASKEPVYAAMESIEAQGGLRWSRLQFDFGPDVIKRLRELHGDKVIAKKADDGAQPEDIAAAHGFESADDMLIQMLDAPRRSEWEKAIVDQKLRNHDFSFDPMEMVADSPEFAEAAEAMAQYYGRALQQGERVATTKAVKDRAKAMIGEMPMGEAVRQDKFMQQVKSHTQRERRAAAKGDFEEALRHNERARLALQLAAEATRVKELRDAVIEKAKSAVAPPPKGQPLKVAAPHMENIAALMIRYGLGLKGAKLNPKKAPLADLFRDVDGTYDMTGQFDERFFNESDGVRYQTLTATEFESLGALVNALDRLGRDIANDFINEGKARLADVVAESTSWMSRLKDKARFFDGSGTLGKVAETLNRTLIGPLTQMDFIFRAADGFNGPRVKDLDPNRPLTKNVVIRSSEAAANAERRFKAMHDQLKPHLKALADALGRIGRRPAGVPGVPEFVQKGLGIKAWTNDQILGMALNMGNTYNRQNLARGLGWDAADEAVMPNQLTSVGRLFTAKEWQAIQGIWDAIGTMKGDLFAAHEKMFGFAPPEVEPTPFTIRTADDQTLTLPGGYFPVRFDSRLSLRQAGQEEAQAIKDMFGAAFAPVAAKRGMTIARKNTGGKPFLLDPARVLTEHIEFTTKFITHGQFVRDTNRLLTNKDWSQLFVDKFGRHVYDELNGWLRSQVVAEYQPMTWFDLTVEKWRPLTSLYVLGLRVKSMVNQVDALASLPADIGVKNYLRGVARMTNPKQLVTDFQFMLDNSTFMRERLAGGRDREMNDLLRDIDLGKFAKVNKAKKVGQHISLAPIIYPSLAMEFVAWNAMFHKAMAEHNGNAAMAVTLADEAISSTQPANRAKDLSRMQRDKKGAARLVTMLMSFSIRRWNANNYMRRAITEGQVSAADAVTYGFLTWVVAPVLPIMILAALWNDWDDEDALKKLGIQSAQELVSYQIQGIPLSRDLLASGVRLAQGQPAGDAVRSAADTPVRLHIKAAEALVSLPEAMAQDDTEPMWALADLVSFYTGVPVVRAYKDLTKGWEQYEAEGNPVNILIPEPKERK